MRLAVERPVDVSDVPGVSAGGGCVVPVADEEVDVAEEVAEIAVDETVAADEIDLDDDDDVNEVPIDPDVGFAVISAVPADSGATVCPALLADSTSAVVLGATGSVESGEVNPP